LAGHSKNLVGAQKNKVNFEIDTLPVIKYTASLDKKVRNFRLVEGFSAETSGGLLICMNKENA